MTEAPRWKWDDAHEGSPNQLGYYDEFLVAQVAYYDVVGGGEAGWVGYINGERVTGRCADDVTARGLVEQRYESGPGRAEAPPTP